MSMGSHKTVGAWFPVMLLFVLLLPALARARIFISIDVSALAGGDKISVTGKDERIVTKSDFENFGMTYSKLVGFCFKSSSEELRYSLKHHRYYKFTDVDKMLLTIKPVHAKILGHDKQSTALAHHKYDNEGPTTVPYEVNLSHEVTNTATHTRDDKTSTSAKEEVSAKAGLWGVSVSVSGSFSYDREWGTGDTISETKTLRSSAGLTIPVQPNHKLDVNLMASHGKMMIEIVYDISLSGFCFEQWMEYKGMTEKPSKDCKTFHSFDGRYVDVLAFMKEYRYSSKLQMREKVKIDFYTDVETKSVQTPIKLLHNNETKDIVVTSTKKPENLSLNSESHSINSNIVFLLIFYPMVHLHV